MTRIATWALVLCATHGVAAQRLAKPVIDTVDHRIVRVMNPGPMAWSDTNGWKLVYERTVQPADGSPGELEKPAMALLAPDGELVVSDWQTPEILLFDRSGRFERILGRGGDGPGEYRQPLIAFHRDTLVIYDNRLGRITMMTLDGTLRRSVPTTVRGNCCEALQIDDAGRIGLSVFRGMGLFRWFQVGPGGHADSIARPQLASPREWTFHVTGGVATTSIPFGATNQYLQLRNGDLLFGTTGQYRFVETRTGTDSIRIFGRTGAPVVPVPIADRDSLFHAMTNHNADLRAVASLADVPTAYPVWRALARDDRDNVWVAADAPGRDRLRFDVFRSDGWFLGSVAAPFPSTAQVFFSGNHIAVIDTDDNDLPRVRIFRIDRRGH